MSHGLSEYSEVQKSYLAKTVSFEYFLGIILANKHFVNKLFMQCQMKLYFTTWIPRNIVILKYKYIYINTRISESANIEILYYNILKEFRYYAFRPFFVNNFSFNSGPFFLILLHSLVSTDTHYIFGQCFNILKAGSTNLSK